MKRAWTYLLVLCLLLPCAADAAKARDASGVTASGGRLRGDIVGVSGESGETALALRVDCPIPPEFTPEQLAVLTTEWIVPDETAVGEAMRATGADWSDGALKRFGPAFAAGSAAPLSPAASGTDADGAREQARATALSFLLDCGLSEGHVIHLLRPEDEARLYALNEAPETREAFVRRSLAEWFTPRVDYTWVQLAFSLRGLPVSPCTWTGADGVGHSCVANLYVGDSGEMRDFTLSYAPREVSAAPYAGAVKTPLEALEDLARQFDCIQPVPREDERGRALPAHWPVVLDIRPAYHTADGVTFSPPGWSPPPGRIRTARPACPGLSPSTHAGPDMRKAARTLPRPRWTARKGARRWLATPWGICRSFHRAHPRFRGVARCAG